MGRKSGGEGMTIEAKVIEDSVSPEGIRLTTFQLRYPRMIHSEFMTHRVFSRNASSSRAIPILTMLRSTVSDMAMPVAWGQNKPGMQARVELTGFRRWAAKQIWKMAGYSAAMFSYLMYRTGAHKQIANRITEPWSHISVVVTATDWQNFFYLRDHADADPTIRALAQSMKAAFDASQPKELELGEWHLPYVHPYEREDLTLEECIKISVARCARVSYLLHDEGHPTLEKDTALHDMLVIMNPKHASPAEHQATPDKMWTRKRWGHPQEHGNFRGWRQYRKTIEGEAIYG